MNWSHFEFCGLSDSLKEIGSQAYFGVYSCFTPIYFIASCSGRVLTLLGFYAQAKQEEAYLYQFFVSILDIFEAPTFTLFLFTSYVFSGFFNPPGVLWFSKCYSCMFLTAHIVNPLQNAFFSCSLFLSISMTVDRIYALARPILYSKVKNRRKQQWVVLIVSLVLAFLISFPHAFIFGGISKGDDGVFILYPSQDTLLLKSFLELHNAVVMTCTFCLILLDFVLVFVYRHRMKKKAEMFAKSNPQSAALELQKVKTLFMLTIIQSITNIFTGAPGFVYQAVRLTYKLMDWGDTICLATFMAPFIDAVREMSDLSTFYLMFIFVKPFRKMVVEGLKDVFRCGTDAVSSFA